MPRLKMRMEMSLLDGAELESLFQKALEVWAQVPFRVQGTQEFFDYLSDYGCQIAGEQVSFPPAAREKVLSRIAEEKRKRLETDAPEQAEPQPELGMYTHGQALNVCDLETNGLRPATQEDLVLWSRAVDALGDVARSHPTFIPTDVPRGSADLHTFATIILNSRRPHRVSVYSAEMLPFFIEACRIAKGSIEEVRREPVFATKCWANAPFMITRENIEIGMDARRLLGVPIMFGHMPVAGASGPLTLAGSLVQNTAESLGLCAMRLAIDDLTQGIQTTAAIMDMKDVTRRQSGPDLALQVLAGYEMNAHVFGAKPGSGLYSVGAQTVSPQSVYEKALAAASGIAAGCRSLGIGCLAYPDVGSPVQLVLDYEMGLYFRHLLRDVKVDDDHVGLDTIFETAPRGAYFLDTDHTSRFFREESWLPRFMDHRPPLAWAREPTDMIDSARKRARELFRDPENQCPLSDAQRREISALLKEADAAAGGD